MNTKGFHLFVFLVGALLLGVVAGFGQETQPTPENVVQGARPTDQRGDMLRQLGLSREQFQQIRRMNMERKPLLDAAQTRFRDAVKVLDEAIYADELNEQDFQTKLKEVQLAQAELHRVRYLNELGLRRILTADQLKQFRELRRQFAEGRAKSENGNLPANRPVREAMRQLKKDRMNAPTSPEPTKQP